ncbi:MAG: hypothetical protein ACYC27_19600 [Armatimonadota bacterium]
MTCSAAIAPDSENEDFCPFLYGTNCLMPRSYEWNIYQFHFLDDLKHIIPTEQIEDKCPSMEKTADYIRTLFVRAGSYPYGYTGVIWIPPFLEADGDEYGYLVWCMRQEENGTLWIASPRKLHLRNDGLEYVFTEHVGGIIDNE